MNIKTLKKWGSFLRFQNVLIIILTQYLIRFLLIEKYIENLNIGDFDFFILVTTTAIIAIGGNVINDIYDFPIDKINKPEKTFINQLITEKNAWQLYHFTNLTAILVSIYFYFFTDWQVGIFYFLITPILLWLYSWKLKKTVLLGNLVVAFICALVPIMVIHTESSSDEKGFIIAQLIIGFYAFFAFISTLYREIVKDIEDKEGDKMYQSLTLPIVFGQQIAKNIALLVGSILLIIIGWLIFSWEVTTIYQSVYMICLILFPIVYSIFQLTKASEKSDFHKVSQTIKLIMLFGLLFLMLM